MIENGSFDVSITESTFKDNNSTGSAVGGIVSIESASADTGPRNIEIQDSFFLGNEASGGACFIQGNPIFGDVSISNTTFEDNLALLTAAVTIESNANTLVSLVFVEIIEVLCIHQDMCGFWHTCLYTQMLTLSYVSVNTFIHVM